MKFKQLSFDELLKDENFEKEVYELLDEFVKYYDSFEEAVIYLISKIIKVFVYCYFDNNKTEKECLRSSILIFTSAINFAIAVILLAYEGERRGI